MKNLLAAIIEINDASFAWYVAACGLFLGIHAIDPAALETSGISVREAAWFVGASAALKCYGMMRKDPENDAARRTARMASARMRPAVLSVMGSGVILWWLLAYGPNKELYDIMKNAGGGAAWAAAMLFALAWSVIISSENPESAAQADERSDAETIKNIYRKRAEAAGVERLSTLFPIRQYAHEAEYASIAGSVKKGDAVLDAGCGDGTLGTMLVARGAIVTLCDISPLNMEMARRKIMELPGGEAVRFEIADAERLPFPDESFDVVVSSHVLEHLPDFERGLAEIRRVTRKKAVIAMPTCCNPCAAILLGGDAFWAVSRWSATAWLVGAIRIILNLGGTGVDERYAGDGRLPHIWRYPWIMRRELRAGGFKIREFRASSFALPYFSPLTRISRALEKYRAYPIVRNLGYGSIAIVEK